METTKVLTKEEIQAALEERHSPEKQKKLSEGRVTIAGLGGLGSNVAYALARIGVGHLHLIDFDVVDITNLNRQQYFTEHIGMYKTDALKSLLQKINPYIDIQTDCIKVTEENLISLFENAGIICEAFDNPEAKSHACKWNFGAFSGEKTGVRIRNGRVWKQQYNSYPAIDEKLLSLRGSGYGTDLWQRIDGTAGCDLRSP